MDSRLNLVFSAIFLLIVSFSFGTPLEHDYHENDNEAITGNNSSVESGEENIIQVSKVEKKCKQYPSIPSEVPLTFESISGMWHLIRAGPPCPEMGNPNDISCSSETYWKTNAEKEPKNLFKSIVRFFVNSTYQTMEMSGKFKPLKENSEAIDPEVIFGAEMGPGKTSEIQCNVIGTDGGQTWLIWACCLDFGGNATTFWSIMSRTPTMDAKREQTLVHYVMKEANVEENQLNGVQQTNCFGNR